ncbi:MAG: 2-oxoglutarate ferredoxin oxidoreductase subunit beta [Verrucomicrobiales bacterium]|jgi:2-oxoglutarate ferredoxin oxidoreductase subunit beta
MATIAIKPPAPPAERAPLKKKDLTADHPTWCPGCGDFAVLASFFKTVGKLEIPHERISTIAGIGCSSRFPYFVNGHGVHFLHGRALPFATGVSLARPDLNVFVFGGDGDGFSIGGNHLEHAARKNVNLTYVIMDNFVYGLTKKQTSPTSPIGFKSKTDPGGAFDQPVNPMLKLVASGATFVARTHASQVKHMNEVFERAILHDGFSVVEVLSECVVFFKGAFDDANPRKNGAFELIEEKVWDDSPEDENRHDVTDQMAALGLAKEAWPGKFGVYLETDRPSKNTLEQKTIEAAQEKFGDASATDLLRSRFEKMK